VSVRVRQETTLVAQAKADRVALHQRRHEQLRRKLRFTVRSISAAAPDSDKLANSCFGKVTFTPFCTVSGTLAPCSRVETSDETYSAELQSPLLPEEWPQRPWPLA
jgi:hypothetical protein